MQGGGDREEKRRAQEHRARDPYPGHWLDLKQKHEKNGADLGESVGLAEDAGAEVPEPGDREQDGAGGENRDVAAEDQNCELPGNLVENRQHQKQGAQQKFVGNRIEVLAEQRLLMKAAGEQAIEAIAETSHHKQNKRPEIVSVHKVDDDEGDEDHPEQSELVGSSEDLRQLHAGSLEGCGWGC